MGSAIENADPFGLGQLPDALQQGHAQGRMGIDKQVRFDRAAGGDFQGTEGLNAVVAQEFEKLKSVVEAHKYLPLFLWPFLLCHRLGSFPGTAQDILVPCASPLPRSSQGRS